MTWKRRSSENLIISIERSGLNWFRHCTEKLTGCPTPGEPLNMHLHTTDFLPFYRCHRIWTKKHQFDRACIWPPNGHMDWTRVILILRDYLDAYNRLTQAQFDGYGRNIIYYHGLEDDVPRMLVLYEDLISDDLNDAVMPMLEFMRLPVLTTRLMNFNMAVERERSKDNYHKYWRKPSDAGKGKVYEVRNAPREEARNRLLKTLPEDLFKIYCRRFDMEKDNGPQEDNGTT